MNAVVDYRVRPAEVSDKPRIARLIQSSAQVHRHLDWRNPLEWVGFPPFLVIESKGQIAAALGCSPDPTSVAWLRLFANSDIIPLKTSWDLLWDFARTELAQKGEYITAAIVMHEWLRDLLLSSGFTIHQTIVMLERNNGAPVPVASVSDISLRPMTRMDLPFVADVDASAFDLLWQNPLTVLERAFPQAELSTVAEVNGKVIGYQLSTRNTLGLHLARLAVLPNFQGKGIGCTLVSHLIRQAGKEGVTHLTVNTQSDNVASLALYQRLGFHESGERYPVYQFKNIEEK